MKTIILDRDDTSNMYGTLGWGGLCESLGIAPDFHGEYPDQLELKVASARDTNSLEYKISWPR